MKIVIIDNFDRECLDDQLVCENIGEFYGRKIVKMLNDNEPESSSNYFDLKPDDYQLREYS